MIIAVFRRAKRRVVLGLARDWQKTKTKIIGGKNVLKDII
jgi:hypothetical protein